MKERKQNKYNNNNKEKKKERKTEKDNIYNVVIPALSNIKKNVSCLGGRGVL